LPFVVISWFIRSRISVLAGRKLWTSAGRLVATGEGAS
jgi:hypothetical protein